MSAIVGLTAFVLLAVNNVMPAIAVLATARLPENETVGELEGWRQLLQSDTVGCSAGVSYPYTWRQAGYGSNANYLILAWANALLEGGKDVGVVVNTDLFFNRTTCVLPSNGEETRRGWHCIFAPMPHLCSFNNREELDEFNNLRGLPSAGQPVTIDSTGEVADMGDPHFIRSRREFIEQSAQHAGIGTFELLAMLYEHLTSHFQPWFKADVDSILAEPDIAAVRAGTSVSLHIRRTDKLIYDKADMTPTEEYLKRAHEYLSTSPGGLSASDIKYLWLSTDDDTVLDEVKSFTRKYFPAVEPEAVVFVTNRVPVRLLNPKTFTSGAQDRNTYEALVLLRVEMIMLAGADVFSGTFSSNLGRIVALMRETLKMPRESALSSDHPSWYPGRS